MPKPFKNEGKKSTSPKPQKYVTNTSYGGVNLVLPISNAQLGNAMSLGNLMISQNSMGRLVDQSSQTMLEATFKQDESQEYLPENDNNEEDYPEATM